MNKKYYVVSADTPTDWDHIYEGENSSEAYKIAKAESFIRNVCIEVYPLEDYEFKGGFKRPEPNFEKRLSIEKVYNGAVETA